MNRRQRPNETWIHHGFDMLWKNINRKTEAKGLKEGLSASNQRRKPK